ncbi:stage II sporulation protein M [Cohnella thailandensis]|uniref:Stage II sporulation protein M n=1 Tax=Cohnella thailandensis TaxID=557557 RepID=A0A841SVZ1_9BACL|nr:stage II sporulation protein M [Cohnella thailandensis]MBB6636453.1 stage II sporulation protein M [Cohnella thailandensis]MBP1977675.1 stage II sporulation protein M [Cohnella thailandensis]
MFTKQGLKQNWRQVKPYVIFATMIFFASIIVGAAAQAPVDWLDKQLLQLQDMAREASESSNPQQTMFTTILSNNIYASLMSMFMGLMAGIMPIATLVLNGMIMGYLFGNVADQGVNIWPSIVKGILPHGVLEIPAILIACAYGVQLGITLLRGIFGSLIGRTDPWGKFKVSIRGVIPAVLLIVVLLLGAAAIESTLTYWLVSA